MQRIVLLTICGVFPALLAAGCGADTEGRIGVSGNVRTNDGKPLRAGRILFTPEKDNAGPAAGGTIKNGSYKILATQGPTAGKYTVIVTTGAPPQLRHPNIVTVHEVGREDDTISLFQRLFVEGRAARQQLVKEHAEEEPDVRFGSVHAETAAARES